MRKHQRRNTYDLERASAAAVRKAQAQPPKAKPNKPKSPEQIAMLDCAETIRILRMRGETVPAELHSRYSDMLKQYRNPQKENENVD